MDDNALDANAVAGMLTEIFGTEMTSVPSQCAHDGGLRTALQLVAMGS